MEILPSLADTAFGRCAAIGLVSIGIHSFIFVFITNGYLNRRTQPSSSIINCPLCVT